MLKHLDLFSGIGGFSLGLESAGLVETVAFCDFDQYCQQVLNKNFPGVPVYGDVKELNYDKLKADGINQIDIITGGYPCQPFSVAGRKKGEQDPRHVWPEMFRLIKELRPTWVIGENVGGHIKLGLDTVLENLESEGYTTRTFSISASSIGANHQRERIWIIANSNNTGDRTSEHEIDKDRKKTVEGRKEQSQLKSSRYSEDMENSGRSQWPWSFEQGEDANETRKEDADQFERSGSTSKPDVANTKSVSSNGREHREYTEEGDRERKVGREGSSEIADWWSVEPSVGRVAHGLPKRVDRLKCLGNSVVPQIPYVIGLAIKETIENEQSIRND